ncbi:MAG: pilus assembly protein PilM [Candidatus Rokubacteria bacterium]|nr:pilus assembly protein PilM [Candidatus Rokubacteria bacterium]
MIWNFLRRRRAVGLDIGDGSIKALVLERQGRDIVITGRAIAAVGAEGDGRELGQAVHGVLAAAGVEGEPVVAAVGGGDVVIRQVTLPPLPRSRILPALEIQHRELGLLPPGESVLDAQILRRSSEGGTNELLSVSAPRALIDARIRLLQQAAVSVQVLDVEPLALLNAAMYLTRLELGELIVVLNIGRRSSVLCLFSEQGPVVARYLDVGSEAFVEAGRGISDPAGRGAAGTRLPGETGRMEAACRELIERLAEDIRLSMTFYRTEYDRESLPRFTLGGWTELSHLSRWLGDRLRLSAPLELLDPFQAVAARVEPLGGERLSGPQFLQAFGLALRAV